MSTRELPQLPKAAYILDLHDGHPAVAYSVQQMYDFARAYGEACRVDEREQMCALIKAADDKAVDEADYMLTSNDCIMVIRGIWRGNE